MQFALFVQKRSVFPVSGLFCGLDIEGTLRNTICGVAKPAGPKTFLSEGRSARSAEMALTSSPLSARTRCPCESEERTQLPPTIPDIPVTMIMIVINQFC